MRRSRTLLSFDPDVARTTLGEGATPLLASVSLGPLLGLESLFFKLESRNPTGSWTDRGSVAVAQRARALGLSRVGVVSSADLGPSLAAYAARASMRCVVLFAGTPEPSTLRACLGHGCRTIQVAGGYAAVCAAALRAGPRTHTYFGNADDPFRLVGMKTLAFELAEQTPGGPPDLILAPIETGHEVSALARGFREWRPSEPGGAEPGILGVSHDDADAREIAAAWQLLAEEEGLVVSERSAATFAVLVREVRARRIERTARIALIISGHPGAPPPIADSAELALTRTTLRALTRALNDPSL